MSSLSLRAKGTRWSSHLPLRWRTKGWRSRPIAKTSPKPPVVMKPTLEPLRYSSRFAAKVTCPCEKCNALYVAGGS